MTREEATRRIERAAKEKLTELYLSELDLEELPSEIAKCTQLEMLVLGKLDEDKKSGKRGNQLTKFPDAVFQLTNLRLLNLNANQITKIPEAINQMSNLEGIGLSSNDITQSISRGA
jgi:Leucine-rich repeat (LRR) protein